MSGKNKFRAVIAGAFGPILLGIVPNSASADEVFAPTAAITIPGNNLASFDISWVDKRLDLYFLADRSNSSVDVVNTRNNQFVAHLPGFIGLRGADNSGPNGVITVHRRNHVEVWAGDGDSTTKVIDLATQTVTHTIATGGANRADELCHDPRNNVVLIANDAETPAPFITFISSDTYTVLGKITMDGGSGAGHGPKATNGIEQCQWSERTGKFYINLPEVNGPGDDSVSGAVLQINPKTEAIEQVFTIPVAQCAGPQGMAIGPDHQILLGCSKTASAIIDERNGHVIASFTNEFGADEIWFNPNDGHYFLGLSNATPAPIVGVIDSDSGRGGPRTDPSVPSAPGSHSIAADPDRNQVYVPVRSNTNPASAAVTICADHGGDNVKGCVLVLTTHHDDRVAKDDHDHDHDHDHDDHH